MPGKGAEAGASIAGRRCRSGAESAEVTLARVWPRPEVPPQRKSLYHTRICGMKLSQQVGQPAPAPPPLPLRLLRDWFSSPAGHSGSCFVRAKGAAKQLLAEPPVSAHSILRTLHACIQNGQECCLRIAMLAAPAALIAGGTPVAKFFVNASRETGSVVCSQDHLAVLRVIRSIKHARMTPRAPTALCCGQWRRRRGAAAGGAARGGAATPVPCGSCSTCWRPTRQRAPAWGCCGSPRSSEPRRLNASPDKHNGSFRGQIPDRKAAPTTFVITCKGRAQQDAFSERLDGLSPFILRFVAVIGRVSSAISPLTVQVTRLRAESTVGAAEIVLQLSESAVMVPG